MKFTVLQEVIAFPEVKKAMIVTSKGCDGEESYKLIGENHFRLAEDLLSTREFRKDLKILSEALFSLSEPVQQKLFRLGVLKLLIEGDTTLCEENKP